MPLDADAMTALVVGSLLAGSLQGTVAIALVWFASRRMPTLPASWLAALWWLAALKLLVAFMPGAAVSIPLLPAHTPMTGWAELAPPDIGDTKPDADVVEASPTELPLPMGATNRHTNRSAISTSMRALVAVWFAGLALHGVRLVRAVRRVRSLVRTSVLAAPEDMEMVARLADVLGLRSAPQVRASSSIETPQLTGVRRPIVLIPVERALTSDDRAMALCHELLHISRHDLVLGWVPALAERLFFFHPLVRLAAREYVTAREVACDIAVVRTLGVSPAAYARLLVCIGVEDRRTVIAAGGASPSLSSLRRRLEMLQYAGDTAKPRRLICSIAAVLFTAMIPFQLVAKESSADRQRIPIFETQRDGVGSIATSAQAPEFIPSAPVARIRETVGTLTSSNPLPAARFEPSDRAVIAQAGEPAALKQQLFEERLKQLEMLRKALDEQAQREKSLLSRETITREMVEEKKREYLDALQAFQEAQERMMRLNSVLQQLTQVRTEQQALRRRQQEHKVAAQSKTYARGDVVTITAAPDGTRPPASRVLAAPGDRIQVSRAGILVNGAPVTELSRDFLAGLPEETWEQVVPPDHYFLAAEQRAETGITLFWGLIPGKRISGRQ